MSLYSLIASAQTQGSKDGDFILPNQKGILLLHGAIYLNRGVKQTAIIVAEVVESNAKIAGATVQTPGTKVKKIYSLSKYDWHINQLKTDLVRIMGLDENELSPKQIEDIMADVFEGSARKGPDINESILRGVLCGFDSSTLSRADKGKTDITKVAFFEVTQGNEQKDVEARKAKLK